MNTFRHCIQSILSFRDLDKVTGQPLYSYKLSDNEFELLKQSLSDSLRSNSISSYVPTAISSEWSGAFVLFASEWWRREFSGGHWSWEPVFGALGIHESELSPAQRSRMVAAGCRYWRRPILMNAQGHMFLGTVAVEGGLPLQLVTDSSSKLAYYFEQVIQDFGKFTLSKPDSLAIAKAHDHHIASSFRNDAVYSVVGKIAEAIFSLADQHDLGKQEDPLMYLDAVEPNWVDRLPLNIEHTVAKSLLDRALGKAIVVQRKMPETIRLLRSLKPQHNRHAFTVDDIGEVEVNYVCSLELTLRSRVNTLYIQQLFNMVSLPERFSLFAVGKKPLLVAKAFRPKNTPDRYLVDVLENQLPADWFSCEIELMARGDQGETWFAPVIGGSSASDKEPWVFIEKEEQWVFAGAGDVICEASKAIIATQQGYVVESASEQCEDIASSALQDNRQLTMLREAGRYNVGQYQIVLGGERVQPKEYVWQGDVLPFQTTPQKSFIGTPKLIELNEQGVRTPIQDSSVHWHDLNKQQWSSLSTLPSGKSEVRYTNQSGTNKHFRIASVPSDFRVDLIPATDLSQGRVIISTSYPPLIALAKDNHDDVKMELSSTEQAVVLELTANGTYPPAYIDIEIWWQDKPKSIEMRLPFPSKGVCLLDAKQQRVDNHSEILVDSLSSYELYGCGLDGEIEVQFSLKAKDVRGAFARSAFYKTVLSSVEDMSAGLSLSAFRSSIQSLFALSTSLDAKVKMEVMHHGHEVFSVDLALYQFALLPDRCNSHVVLSSAASSHPDNIVSIELFTIPLGQPDQTPIPLKLESVDDSERYCWHMPDEELEPGAWLVYCNEPKFGIRPVMWTKDLQLIPAPKGAFEAAAGISWNIDRIKAFSHAAKELAADYSSVEWKYVRTLLAFNQVPLTTFDLWRGASQQPEFMLALLLQANKSEIEAVWQMDTQLPMLWTSLDIKQSIKVVRAYYEYLLERLGGEGMEELVQDRIMKKLSELESFFPSLSSLIQLLGVKIAFNLEKSFIEVGDYTAQLRAIRGQLAQRKCENEWPCHNANDVFGQVMQRVHKQIVELCLTGEYSFKNNVMNAPVLLALATAGHADLRMTAEVVHAMREYRRFDETYFDEAFNLTQKLIIGLLNV
ncbi:STY4851/ECs_5259 family protein [Vibrio mediterranei]|uniref:STY4851/ECs_5259 family protein n=1 Tax=Vibrio mediterranei TaxID=689 RepID=UPI001EFCC715|nr:STY4851/ECs_5259 family protein [Vibrio mediterranei]MCG9665932.1 STY4851/ECs_5259 family protein [Vibrio mediterranei]